jgi:hypothetical protein
MAEDRVMEIFIHYADMCYDKQFIGEQTEGVRIKLAREIREQKREEITGYETIFNAGIEHVARFIEGDKQ